MRIISLEKKDLLKVLVAVSILIKTKIYYHYMDVDYNYIYVLALTVAYIGMIFFIFKNKIFPAVLYLVFSIIMFMDISYFSYFNRNLSIDMIEAVGFLGDVSDSVFEVVKPRFLLVLLDSVLILLYFIRQAIKNKKIHGYESSHNPKVLYLRILVFIGVLLVGIFSVSGQMKSDITTSVMNQEFFSFHATDIAAYLRDEPKMQYEESFEQINKDYESHVGKEWFGIGKGKNLIVIQVESLQDFVVNETYNGQEITPFLNQLTQRGSFYFPNYFQQLGGGNTSDAEFVSHNSLYASNKSYTYSLFNENHFRGLPWILKNEGYQTAVFHGYKKDFWSRAEAYPSQGFDDYYSEEHFGIDEVVGLGLTDKSFFNQSMKHLKKIQQPFYSFFVTLSMHHPYNMLEADKQVKLKVDDVDTLFGNYIHAANYVDQCIETFVDALKANGLYENTVIVIYGDHFGLNCKDERINEAVSDFIGYEYYYDEMMNIPLIIHIPDSEVQKTIYTVGGQIDFLPTLAYIMGIEELETLFFGQNLIHAEKGFVASQTFMLKGSFIQDGIVFEISRDGVFSNSKAWDLETKKPIDIQQFEENYMKAVNDINLGNYLLDHDILRKIYKDQQSIQELVHKVDLQ